MKKGFVLISSDFNRVTKFFNKNDITDAIYCFHPQQVENLNQVDEIYFVFSKIATGSTHLQMTVQFAFSATSHLPRWLINLDDVIIPPGFFLLQSLPLFIFAE